MILTQSLTNKLSILILLIISFVLVNHNGIDNNPISNINQLIQNSILQHNNQIASNVAPENRDNFIPAIPFAYTLAGTVLTNEYLKSQGDGDVGVGAHRVANQVKEGVSTAYEGIKSVDPHLRQSLENVEDAASFMVSKTITGSDAAVSSLFDTNSNQPVTETLAQVNQWYDNLPESQKGLVDLTTILSSVVGVSYLNTTNKAINKPDVDLGGVGNNGPGISNPIPDRMARIVQSKYSSSNTLGIKNSPDVFVTSTSDIANIANSTELARRLTLLNPDGSLMRGPFTIYEFDSPKSGIASPVFRENAGFVSTGTGRTAGGAREFVIPNFEKNTLNNLIEREVK